jgi:rubrerythrin
MSDLTQQEIINVAIKKAMEYETSLATKYADLVKTITEPTIQKHLQSLEQTARNHLNLLTQQMQRANIQ